jgi:DNA-binding GntR family transcriptional regulator
MKINRGNLSEQVYSGIRGSLMDGQYEPGDRLRISGLAEELGVSITPVREAIFRLVSDQALEMKAATAVHVRDLNPNELEEIQRIRFLLEGEAAGIAAERITAKELSALEDIQERFSKAAATDSRKASVLNRQFHFGVVAAAKQPLIMATVENMWTLMGPLLRTFHVTMPVRDLASLDHKHYAVLEGLRNKDAKQAKDALQADIRWGHVMVDWLREKQSGQDVVAK